MAADPAVIYFVGPNGPVDVPLARAANVSHGDAVRVEDPTVRAGLLVQDENWSATPPATETPAKADKPAAKAADTKEA